MLLCSNSRVPMGVVVGPAAGVKRARALAIGREHDHTRAGLGQNAQRYLPSQTSPRGGFASLIEFTRLASTVPRNPNAICVQHTAHFYLRSLVHAHALM